MCEFVAMLEFDKREVKPNLYAYKDIKLATNNFGIGNKLGEGGFGIVYKVLHIHLFILILS